MSEGGSKPTNTEGDVTWGRAKLGQSALLIELIGRVQGLRVQERSSNVCSSLIRHELLDLTHILAPGFIT